MFSARSFCACSLCGNRAIWRTDIIFILMVTNLLSDLSAWREVFVFSSDSLEGCCPFTVAVLYGVGMINAISLALPPVDREQFVFGEESYHLINHWPCRLAKGAASVVVTEHKFPKLIGRATFPHKWITGFNGMSKHRRCTLHNGIETVDKGLNKWNSTTWREMRRCIDFNADAGLDDIQFVLSFMNALTLRPTDTVSRYFYGLLGRMRDAPTRESDEISILSRKFDAEIHSYFAPEFTIETPNHSLYKVYAHTQRHLRRSTD